MKMKALGLIVALAIPLATGCAAHKTRVADETVAPRLSSSPDGNMLDPWGNTYTVVLPDSEPRVAISPAKVMIDPWSHPYKIVPR